MHLNRRNIVILIVLLASTLSMSAQEVSYSVHGAEGMLIKKDESMAQLIRTQGMEYYGLSAMWKAKGDSVSIDDEMWGRPTIEGGLMLGDLHRVKLHRDNHACVADVDYFSGLGYMITPFAAFRRSLTRSRRLDAGYKFENGIGITTRPYDAKTNVENEIIGSRISVFIGMGLYASWHVTDNVSLGVDATFRHYSNGKLNQPNVGINTVDVGVKATYTLQPDTVVRTPYSRGFNHGFKKYVYADVNVGWCPQTLLPDWNYEWNQLPENRRESFKCYNAWSASVAAMWRYSRKYASGIGVDYTYVPFTDAITTAENCLGQHAGYELSPHVLGVSLQHEAFYKNVSMRASIGYFLQKRLGYVADANQKRYYETIGLRWYLPFVKQQMYLGYNINACAIKANYFQFVVGYCPWK